MKYSVVIVLLFLLLFTACQPPEKPAPAGPPAPPAGNTNPSPPPAPRADLSPKEVLQALNQASKQKNVVEIKRYLSQGALQLLRETAETNGKTPDQVLTEDGAPFAILPEMRDEKITGGRATVEVQNFITKGYENIPFVKENGEWKVALDVYTRDLQRRAAEAMKTTAPKSANPKK